MIDAPRKPEGPNSNRRTLFRSTLPRTEVPSPRLAPAPSRRQLPVVAVGVLLVVGCALVFAVASINLGNRQAVLAVTQRVAAGQTIRTNDLTVVHVGLDSGVVPVSATDEATIIGRPAAVPLVPNSLLTLQQVGSSAALSANQAIVGIALKDGQFPPGLAAGAHVMVVETPGAALDQTAAGAGGTNVAAVVVDVRQPQATSAASTIVSIRVDSTDAPQIAVAAASNHVALIEVASTS